MKGHNFISLSGRLTKDIKEKAYDKGIRYSFTLAVNQPGSEDAVFFPVYFWQNEPVKQVGCLKKGTQVIVTGRVLFREYKDGEDIKSIVEVKADGLTEFNDNNMPELYGYIGQMTGLFGPVSGFNIGSFITEIIGAIVLLALYRVVKKR